MAPIKKPVRVPGSIKDKPLKPASDLVWIAKLRAEADKKDKATMATLSTGGRSGGVGKAVRGCASPPQPRKD